MKKLNKKEILEKNPQTDRKVVSDYERLAVKLKKLGIDTKPRYSLSPPLGDGVVSAPLSPQSSLKKVWKP